MNERTEIEAGVEGLLQPLVADKTLKTVKSIGGYDYETILKAMLAQPPCALIKYLGKTGELQGGGYVHYQAEISILIIAKTWKTVREQRQDIYGILEAIEAALIGKRIGTQGVYWPLVLVAEQWSELTGSGVEAWEHRYLIQWDEKPAD